MKPDHVFETHYDRSVNKTVQLAKQVPVMINYSIGKNRYEKLVDTSDLMLVERIKNSEISFSFPTNNLPKGDKTRDPNNLGITHAHHFYTERNLLLMVNLWKRINDVLDKRLQHLMIFLYQSLILGYTKLNRYGATHYSQVNRYLNGTLYVSSMTSEVSLSYAFDGKLSRLIKAFASIDFRVSDAILTTQSSTQTEVLKDSLDYIFVDPPFGANLMYSELNFLWESWLSILTNTQPEAIINKSQRKNLPDYTDLMESCFYEFYRLLKPNHWMTVEFHNSKNYIWNNIQEAILRAGFVVADVRSIDKKQGSFNQVTASGAVKQDLIISAYKPRTGFEQRFLEQAGTTDGAWDFVRQHLTQLPVVVNKDGQLETLSERQDYLLFDRMVAFHIQRGATVPLSAAEFYAGLEERFPSRDGMYFLPDQVPEYDRARLQAESVAQLSLFVSDEKTAIQWLRQQLDPKLGGEPQTYQDIQPKFLRQLHQAKHEDLPELGILLEQSFLQDDKDCWYVPDPHKISDLEKIRRKTLLREFKTYLGETKNLKQFRTEAVRAGFADAYQRKDFPTILQVAARLPNRVLQEDPDLLMYYDAASLRSD
ncbi:MAG: hypothetical protein B5M51_07430 [Anaerolinea sp. 4484_236]|nr:MAG: hypothetical protein B5M51_07430 [Anaerolinea sp. 4484_236]